MVQIGRGLARISAGLILTVSLLIAQRVRSQNVIPATDGTATTVTQTGNQYNISGGTQAGANLFHSLQQFGLTTGEIANFLSHPDIQNILTRVVGGTPSQIAGIIQVTGGNSNLFLLNPAGIIFHPGASLNVSGDFTATTANGISIGNQWFSTNTNLDIIRNLVGTPNTLGFTTSQPGAIINQANLAVNPGKNITLAGGTVIRHLQEPLNSCSELFMAA